MNRKQWIIFSVTLALIAGTAVILARVKARQRLGSPGLKVSSLGGDKLHIDLPDRVLDYGSVVVEPAQIEVDTLPRDTTIGRRIYRAGDGFPTLVSAVLMGADRTSIHKPEFCLPGQGWGVDRKEAVSVPVVQAVSYVLPVMKFTATKQGMVGGQWVTRRGIYIYWFVADGRVTASHTERMWSMASGLMRDNVLQRWAYVSCFSDCAPGQEEQTFARMKDFIAAAVPQFQTATGPIAAVRVDGLANIK